ncbi:MAG TPA: phage baseplate assembly protein V [Pyrinomonadaceae bacterium]
MGDEHEQLLVELHQHASTHYYGKYRGKVMNVEDPEKLGRIQALVPEIYGEEGNSPWAMPAAPFAGSQHGFVFIPELEDGVWIEFEAGDISRPIWTGGWWADGELPAPGATKTRAIVTTAGHKLVLDDEGKEIHLLHSGGAELKMSDSEINLTIGQSEFKMTSEGEISLKAGTTEIKLSLTELSLQSGIGKVKLSATGADVNNGAIKVM